MQLELNWRGKAFLFFRLVDLKLHDTIDSGQSVKSLYKSDVSFNFVRQDVISGLWFTEKLKAPTDMSSCETLVQSRLSEAYFILSKICFCIKMSFICSFRIQEECTGT